MSNKYTSSKWPYCRFIGNFFLTVPVCDREKFHFAKMAFGDYPVEYNPSVHGPYDPARFYGKRKYSYFNLGLNIKRYNEKFNIHWHYITTSATVSLNWFMFFHLSQNIYKVFFCLQPTPHSARSKLAKSLHGWHAVTRAPVLLLDPWAVPGGVGTTSMCNQSAPESHHSFRLSLARWSSSML